MAGVTFDHVYKSFGEVEAVADLNLEVADKEFLVIVGPSGCGKSTTLRLLAGLEDISDGIISIDERVVNDVPPKDRDIAMVFQSYALYPHMTVYDNMAFGLRLRGTPKEEIESRVNNAAEILGIESLLERRPRQLSGGQRQRVAVGRAIVRQPKVFLLDEPLSNLDAKLRVQTRAEIQKLHRDLETTFVYVTHDQTEAMTMATRIAVMKDGILQQADTPQILYDEPANLFVGGFIGSPAMNFFNAKLVQSNGDLIVDVGDFSVPVPDDRKSTYGNHAGKDVVLGIRPEDIHDPEFTPPGISSAEVESNVSVIEPMGNEKILYLDKGGQSFVARVDPRSSAFLGNEKHVLFDMSNMHLFEMQDEQAAIR